MDTAAFLRADSESFEAQLSHLFTARVDRVAWLRKAVYLTLSLAQSQLAGVESERGRRCADFTSNAM